MSLKFSSHFASLTLTQLKHGLHSVTHAARARIEHRLQKISATMQTMGIVDALRAPGGLVPIMLGLAVVGITGIYPRLTKLKLRCCLCENGY